MVGYMSSLKEVAKRGLVYSLMVPILYFSSCQTPNTPVNSEQVRNITPEQRQEIERVERLRTQNNLGFTDYVNMGNENYLYRGEDRATSKTLTIPPVIKEKNILDDMGEGLLEDILEAPVILPFTL